MKNTSKKSVKRKENTSKKWLFTTVILSIMAAVVLSVYLYMSLNSNTNEQAKMATYLRDKYGKEFVVEQPELTGSGLGIKGTWRATAHPRNETIVFQVGKSEREDRFFDSYAEALWIVQERPKIVMFLNSLYSSVPDFELSAHIITNSDPDPIRGEVPTIDRAIEQYRDRFFYGLTLKFTANSLSGTEKEDYRSKFKEIASYIESRNIASPSLRFAINLKDKDYGILCDAYKEDFSRIDEITKTCFDHQVDGKAW